MYGYHRISMPCPMLQQHRCNEGANLGFGKEDSKSRFTSSLESSKQQKQKENTTSGKALHLLLGKKGVVMEPSLTTPPCAHAKKQNITAVISM